MSSARIGSDLEEPAYESEWHLAASHPTRKGQVQIRRRLRMDRSRPNIDAARAASDPEESHSMWERVLQHRIRHVTARYGIGIGSERVG
jgi:hypothetical protein